MPHKTDLELHTITEQLESSSDQEMALNEVVHMSKPGEVHTHTHTFHCQLLFILASMYVYTAYGKTFFSTLLLQSIENLAAGHLYLNTKTTEQQDIRHYQIKTRLNNMVPIPSIAI